MNREFMGLCCSILALAALCISFFLIDSASAQSGADRPLSARPGGPDLAPGVRPDAAMCCGRGPRRWMTTIQSCRRAGGRPLPQSACRSGRRVCCRRGAGYFWATAQSCSGQGRTVVPTEVCSVPGKRVCCSGRRYPRLQITTRRQCDQTGGQAVQTYLCRTRPDPRQRLTCCVTPDGNRFLTRRECGAARGRPVGSASCRGPVCCERDGRRSFTRLSRCRQNGGRIVSYNRCRVRGGTVRPR